MLTEVKQQTDNAMLHKLMAYFESSMLSALNQICPDIPQEGCLFHFSKTVFRHTLVFGLQPT